MKAVFRPVGRVFGGLFAGLISFRRETRQSLMVWAVMAALNIAVQIVWRRDLAAGEFATLNTVLAAVALTLVPVAALRQAIDLFLVREKDGAVRESFSEARLPLIQNFTLVWIFVCALVFLPALALLELPRFLISLLALPNVLMLLAVAYCAAIYEGRNRLLSWTLLLFFAGIIRLFLAWLLAGRLPWAESGLVAGTLALVILISPLLRQGKIVSGGGKAWRVLRNQEFRLQAGATMSVLLGIFLFINGDRLVAQSWFGNPSNNNMGLVNWSFYDGYQTAGLLGRALLWGTQPLLLLLLVRRAPEDRTSPGVRDLFWGYLVVLLVGSFLLYLFRQQLAQLFGGGYLEATTYFIPGFAVAMVPLGVVQGMGIFALASRRYPECFTLGACSVAYVLFLAAEGNTQLMLACMFGGGLVTALILFFIGVVRWGRRQP